MESLLIYSFVGVCFWIAVKMTCEDDPKYKPWMGVLISIIWPMSLLVSAFVVVIHKVKD